MGIILDSSLLIAFKVKNDFHHERAQALMREVAGEMHGKPLVTDYIFDETVTGIFVRSKDLRLAVEYGKELLASLDVLRIDEQIFHQAWKIFSEQEKRELSFTDSTTLAAMKSNDISKIGTFDRDFREIEQIELIS